MVLVTYEEWTLLPPQPSCYPPLASCPGQLGMGEKIVGEVVPLLARETTAPGMAPESLLPKASGKVPCCGPAVQIQGRAAGPARIHQREYQAAVGAWSALVTRIHL